MLISKQSMIYSTNIRVDLLELQYNFIRIKLGFGHCPPFIEVILYGDNNSLKIKVPHSPLPAYGVSFVWK